MWECRQAGGFGPLRMRVGVTWAHLRDVSGCPRHDLAIPRVYSRYDTDVTRMCLNHALAIPSILMGRRGWAGENKAGRKLHLGRCFRGSIGGGVV